VPDQHGSYETPLRDNLIEFALLVVEGVGVVLWTGLVRSPPAEEVEQDEVTTAKMRDQTVVEVQVIGEPVHQNDGGFRAGILADVEAVESALHPLLGELLPAGSRLVGLRRPHTFRMGS
jgi:hypothetical protein